MSCISMTVKKQSFGKKILPKIKEAKGFIAHNEVLPEGDLGTSLHII